jgi:hypothetical protein
MENNTDIAITQPKLLLLHERALHDAVASYWTMTTMLFYDGSYANVSDTRYQKELETYTIKGAA